MNVERIIFWLRFVAQLILELAGEPDGDPKTPDGWGPETAHDPGQGVLPPVEGMKPERIQFWVGQLARFVLEVVEGTTGETGKSGEVN